LVDRASIYEESLKENVAEYADQKRRAQGTGTSIGGVEPVKRMAVGSFLLQRSQGHASGNQFCSKRIRHWICARSVTVYTRDPAAIGTCYW
jgi:hypothetical protein